MKKFLAVFDHAMNFMSLLACLILVFIMLSVCLEVVLRYFFNHPLVWVTEVTECLLLYVTFLGAAWLLREEGHVKVDIIVNRLKPNKVAFFGILTSMIGGFVSITLTVLGFKLTWHYFQRGMYTPTAMEIPVSIIIVIIPIGSLMLFVQFMRRTVIFTTGFLIETKKASLEKK
ncbi:MAG: TRAP transporter small permease [Deltaproteobacteria bacterium]|nr:TRAP transporter small permease [Deltaproteobacteria bacterium]